MAGAGLLDLKRRIRSVTNTQKITKAMGLVATAKFKKLRQRAEKATPYFDRFHESITQLAVSPDMGSSKYFLSNNSDKDIYIIVSSDSGLAGSFNTNVLNTSLNHMADKKVELITVGAKAKAFFNRRGFDTIAEFVELGDTPSFKDASDIMRPAVEKFLKGEAGNVFLIYTKFHNTIKQTVEVQRILPMEKPEGESQREVLFEPSPREVFEYVMPKYLNTAMYYSLVNSIASMYAMRMNAMDNASKNADELLNALNLKFNRARQSSITQEITEIVSGAEALKD